MIIILLTCIYTALAFYEANSPIAVLNRQEFTQKVQRAQGPVLVKFFVET